jgi:hypothetical protein
MTLGVVKAVGTKALFIYNTLSCDDVPLHLIFIVGDAVGAFVGDAVGAGVGVDVRGSGVGGGGGGAGVGDSVSSSS